MGLLTVKDVARLFDKGERQVRYAIYTGMLSPIKMGSNLFFEEDDLPKSWTIRPKSKNSQGAK